jgi:hypothetical protein
MRFRLFLGVVTGALGVAGTTAAVHSLIVNVALAHGELTLILPGLLGPVLIMAAAALLLRIAYRNLFWRRYVASRRPPLANASTRWPNMR